MKKHAFLFLTGCALAFASCSDEESASIIGTWEGTQFITEASVAGIPVQSETDDTFNTGIEFKEDGSVLVNDVEDDFTSEGTWAYEDGKKKIAVSGAFPDNEIFEPTETFTIKELSNSKLTLYLEKTMMLQTDNGDFEGLVKATFKFTRTGN
ncbi:MAG TPA: lipocalin family protein [Cyclobacteriaceae bacterium]|nr:lipocalin family protein [Cyclobacteriaceae bacterium]